MHERSPTLAEKITFHFLAVYVNEKKIPHSTFYNYVDKLIARKVNAVEVMNYHMMNGGVFIR